MSGPDESRRTAAHGPYETEAQVRERLAQLAAKAREGGEDDARRLQVRELLDAAAAAGTEPGSYDLLILASIGQWEPKTTVVLIGLIERAHAAGRRGAK